jgi:hypothetical protein
VVITIRTVDVFGTGESPANMLFPAQIFASTILYGFTLNNNLLQISVTPTGAKLI